MKEGLSKLGIESVDLTGPRQRIEAYNESGMVSVKGLWRHLRLTLASYGFAQTLANANSSTFRTTP